MNKASGKSATYAEQRMRLQSSIIETTDDAVVALDRSMNIRYCNAAAEQLYGVRLPDVAGKALAAMHGFAWINKEDEERFLSDLARHGSWRGEYIHILNNGCQIVVQSTVNVLEPAAGGGMVAVIRDVTDKKVSELKSQKHSTELMRANEDLLHFAYAVGHDLREPLRTVISFVQLLTAKHRQKLDGQASEVLCLISAAASRMNLMLSDLLQFAQVAGERGEFSEQVELEDALSTAIASLNDAVAESGAAVTHDSLPAVVADRAQTVQLFQNLISNALKYRKPDTPVRVHVSANRTAGEWSIAVRDNGIGFDAKDSERIFGVFERLHGKEIVGTGIGLTICKRIVERRGGRIWADAQPGDGATFHFTIPDTQETVQGTPPMKWENLLALLDRRAFNPSHIGELSKALDLAPAIVRELNGIIVFWTKGAERLFGFTEAETLGKQLHSVLRSELSISQDAVEFALVRDGEWAGEMQAHRKDGSIMWLAVHKVLYRDSNGRPKSVVEVHHDITSLKRVEAALVDSIEQRDLSLNAARMGIWHWDPQTGAVQWSQTVESMLGMAPGSFEGTYEAFQERLHPDDRQVVQEQIARAWGSGSEYTVESRLRHASGEYVWVRGKGRVIQNEEKQNVGLVGVVWDVSESNLTHNNQMRVNGWAPVKGE